MKETLLKLYLNAKYLINDDRGQDMIEYILVAALIALAATAGMSSLAGSINTAFTSIGGKLTTYTS